MTEQELLQVPEELRELFVALDKQGWNPQMCDTLVPYYANGVPCASSAARCTTRAACVGLCRR